MNPVIERYFDEVELRLIESPVVLAYQIVRREVAPADGKLRIAVTLEQNDFAELFEYVSEISGIIRLLKYSFHWQDVAGNLKRRWDNAPHYPNLPNAPHHIHAADGSVTEASQIPSIFQVIETIEKALKK